MTQKDSQDDSKPAAVRQDDPGGTGDGGDAPVVPEVAPTQAPPQADAPVEVTTWARGWVNPPPFTQSAPPSWREIHAHALRVVPEPLPADEAQAGGEVEHGVRPVDPIPDETPLETGPETGAQTGPQTGLETGGADEDSPPAVVEAEPAPLPEPLSRGEAEAGGDVGHGVNPTGLTPLETPPEPALADEDLPPPAVEAEPPPLPEPPPPPPPPPPLELTPQVREARPAAQPPEAPALTPQVAPPLPMPPREHRVQLRIPRSAAYPADARFELPDRAPADGWERAKGYARNAVRYALYAVAGYFAVVFLLILLYRFVNPPASMLMLVQGATGTDVQQQWVPLDEISPSLIRAVIVSEDWSFCEHYGIDIKAIEQAIEKSGSGIPRGASTISMQLTKNLFLWNAKSYVRKAIELPLTLMIELIWPKWRILEVYLNVVEWGPGVFGAEAAAQYHFAKSAVNLGDREAAQLAAALPNPMTRDAGDPGPRTARKANVVQSRMRNAGGAAQCVLGPRKEMAQ